MKKHLAAAAIVSMLACTADAAVVNITGITSQWTSTTPLVADGVGTNSIRWGDPATSAGKSGYDFAAATVPINNVEAGSTFNLGNFVHHNNPITNKSIAQATLEVAVRIMIGATEQVVSTVYTFNHWETSNFPGKGSVCANGGAQGAGVNTVGCADRVTAVVNLASTSSFLIGDDEYVFTLDGFKVGSDIFSEFWTKEGTDNAAFLQGSYVLKSCVTANVGCTGGGVAAVPLPAAGWMLLAGLCGLGLITRKRRSA